MPRTDASGLAKIAAAYPEQARFLVYCARSGDDDAMIRRRVEKLASLFPRDAATWTAFFEKLAAAPMLSAPPLYPTPKPYQFTPPPAAASSKPMTLKPPLFGTSMFTDKQVAPMPPSNWYRNQHRRLR